MNTFNKLSYALVFAIALLVSCNSKSGHDHHHEEVEDENLIEANKIHQQSLDIREELLQVEKDLKDAEIDYTELKEELKIWDKDIIEVPGFEHSHDDAHQRKYHVHNPMKEFTPVEHKNYQQVMHDEIVELSSKLKRRLSNDVMAD
ncbi:hypothetical protein ACFOUP_07520 [Belliella kenyensis]|uniref:Lipoprotein n=1 Tax=Belliella kenyensis TaxID=1472724 RepID=A0ABV8EK75_9BACT|nr:hypothetical protein [Belliella kenyensis]MCH7400322.1 hypothetical protein [Belliella kenyensis]MDN3604660.1 hypothetical protein [Belliella kenyensis]